MNTTYWLNKIMKTQFVDNTPSLFIGLSSSAPSKDGTGYAEPTQYGYARAPIGTLTAPENGTVTNENTISFQQSSGVWFPDEAKAKYWLLFDGSGANANLLSYGALASEQAIGNKAIAIIPAGGLAFSLSDA